MNEAVKNKQVAIEEIAKPKIIDYAPKEEGNPQLVREFGTDAHSLNAKAMYHAFCYLFTNKKMEKVHSNHLIQLVQKNTGKDIYALFHNDFPDSPIHRGAHALCKNETLEKTEKEGAITDRFARGERGLVLKEGKVGPKSKGYYFPNPAKNYPKIEPHALKRELQGLIDRCKRCH